LREEKVFNQKYTSRSYTVPKPFNLSYQHRSNPKKLEAIKSEQETKELQECTFEPETMEQKKKPNTFTIFSLFATNFM